MNAAQKEEVERKQREEGPFGEYDIADEESVHAFGVIQGRALFTYATTQGSPDWPVCDPMHADFIVGTPPDIMA